VKYFRIGQSSWRQLDPINSGYVEADQIGEGWRIHYYLDYTRTMIGVSVIVLLWGGTLFAINSTPSLEVIGIMAAAWGWLFGVGFLISVIMFRRLVKRALKDLRANIG
jgi:hypothetical protein